MNNENNSYYECKRCFYTCYQKNHMKNHLNKKKICEKKFDAYKYSDDDLVEMSLIRQYKHCNINNLNNEISFLKKLNDINNNINNKKNEYICHYCNKKLHTNSTLQRHMKLYCKYKNIDKCAEEVSESIISNIDNSIYIDNSVTNNIVTDNSTTDNSTTININIVNSFSEEWCTKHIDDKTKALLFLNNAKFTATLENILENEVNLNVLIDKNTDKGIIFENNMLKNITVKEIVNRTMEKLHKHLEDFQKNAEKLTVDSTYISDSAKNTYEKYNKYKSNTSVQNNVNSLIKDIYCKKQNDAVQTLQKVGY